MRYFNRVRVATATAGTGTLTYGAAVSDGFLTPEEAGCVNGDLPVYVIEEGNDFEMAWGVIDTDTDTLTRNVITSKIGGVQGTAKMNLGGNAQIRFIGDASAFAREVVVKSGASPAEYSAGYIDRGKTFVFTDVGGATLAPDAVATLGDDWHLTVMARGGDLTFDPNGAETIEGASTYTVPDGDDATIRCDGSAFRVSHRRPPDSGVSKPFSRGSVSTGTETPEPSDGMFQTATNDGAHTLAAPTETGAYRLVYSNGASAGPITSSGFDEVIDDDTALLHTIQNSVIEIIVVNDGVKKVATVTLITDASA